MIPQIHFHTNIFKGLLPDVNKKKIEIISYRPFGCSVHPNVYVFALIEIPK